MPNLDLAAFVADLTNQITAVWTDIPGSRVDVAEHLELVAWGDLTPPYVVIHCNDFERGDYGAANLSFEFPAQVYRVEVVGGSSSGLTTQLLRMVDWMWPKNPLTAGQVLEVDSFSTSEALEPNRQFIEAGSQRRAGMVQLRCQVTYTPQR